MRTRFDHLRTEDHEHVGYLEMTDDDLFVPYDLLHRRRGEPSELEVAEAALDELGLRPLAEEWLLDVPGEGEVRVRILEVDRERATVARTIDGGSLHVATTIDLTRTLRITLPAAGLHPAPRPGRRARWGDATSMRPAASRRRCATPRTSRRAGRRRD